jgi:hypothetical protein
MSPPMQDRQTTVVQALQKNPDALAISALAAGRVFVPARKPAMAASFQWIAKMRTLGHLGFMCLMNFLLVFQYEICILLQ